MKSETFEEAKEDLLRILLEEHISTIRQGDTVLHDGELRTVCKTDMKRGFMGLTIFGDSYSLGTAPVIKALSRR